MQNTDRTSRKFMLDTILMNQMSFLHMDLFKMLAKFSLSPPSLYHTAKPNVITSTSSTMKTYFNYSLFTTPQFQGWMLFPQDALLKLGTFRERALWGSSVQTTTAYVSVTSA